MKVPTRDDARTTFHVRESRSKLETLPLITAVVGYEHDCAKCWTSTVAWSIAEDDAPPEQAADALHQPGSSSINLVYRPAARFAAGIEYRYGERDNNDGQDGHAQRVQPAFRFVF